MGRKSKEEIILQNLDVIREMKKNGCPDTKIFKHIKIAPATFYKFLKSNEEIQKVWNDAKADLVIDLEGTLYKLAKGGFTITTTRTYENEKGVFTDTTEKEMPPNLGALIFLLKNLCKEKYTNEPNMLDIKRKELELKEKYAEMNSW